jgi:hypothetical protein
MLRPFYRTLHPWLGDSSVCSVYKGRMGPNSGFRALENKNLLPLPEPEPARSLVRIPIELTRLLRNDDQCLSKLNVFRTRRRTSILVEILSFLSFLPSFLTVRLLLPFRFLYRIQIPERENFQSFFKLLCTVYIYEVILCNIQACHYKCKPFESLPHRHIPFLFAVF